MFNLRLVLITFAVFLFCGSAVLAAPVCSEADTQRLFWYVAQPTLESKTLSAFATRPEAGKWARTQVRIELNRLHELTNAEDDQAIRAHFDAQGRPEVSAWITERGGYKYLGPRIACFKEHYKRMIYEGNCGLVNYWLDTPIERKPIVYIKRTFITEEFAQ